MDAKHNLRSHNNIVLHLIKKKYTYPSSLSRVVSEYTWLWDLSSKSKEEVINEQELHFHV